MLCDAFAGELIDTQWDVNSVVIAMACQESGELIDTQWDVNFQL